MFKIYKLYSKQRRLYRYGIITFGVLAVLIGIITFYGQNTGNFVISVDQDLSRVLVLSKTKDFSSYGSRLVVNAVEDARDITYSWLKVSDAVDNDGDYIDPHYKYLAFTFYLSNYGTEATDVEVRIEILEETNNIGDAIRILLVDDSSQTMYMRADKTPHVYPDDIPPAVHFQAKNTVFTRTIENFRKAQVKKYTIFMWLEGEDPDCIDSIARGKIKMQMFFGVVSDNR